MGSNVGKEHTLANEMALGQDWKLSCGRWMCRAWGGNKQYGC